MISCIKCLCQVLKNWIKLLWYVIASQTIALHKTWFHADLNISPFTGCAFNCTGYNHCEKPEEDCSMEWEYRYIVDLWFQTSIHRITWINWTGWRVEINTDGIYKALTCCSSKAWMSTIIPIFCTASLAEISFLLILRKKWDRTPSVSGVLML